MRAQTLCRILCATILLLMATACTKTPSRQYDLTKDDIFLIQNIKSTDVGVRGIGLGDSKDQLVQVFGKADKEIKFNGTMLVNDEYGKALGLNDTGLIFQVENGAIKKITVKKPFNKFLHGKTQINFTKEDLYFNILGVPDRQETTPWFRVFYYDAQGIEVLLGKTANGFALAYPSAAPPTRRKLTAQEIDAYAQMNPNESLDSSANNTSKAQPMKSKNQSSAVMGTNTTEGNNTNGMEY